MQFILPINDVQLIFSVTRMKTTGKIQKNAKKKAPHPNSRKALKLAGAKCREARIAENEDRKAQEIAQKITQYQWFQVCEKKILKIFFENFFSNYFLKTF